MVAGLLKNRLFCLTDEESAVVVGFAFLLSKIVLCKIVVVLDRFPRNATFEFSKKFVAGTMLF